MRMLMVAFILILTGCSGGQGASTPTPADPTPTPSPVVQAECPEPTVCPGPTTCLSAPTCPEPVTCPTCATSATCPEPVVCPTCPEPVICPDCPVCPQTCPETRTGLRMCIEEKQNSVELWYSCDQELQACQFGLGQCSGLCGKDEGWDLSEQTCTPLLVFCPLGVEFDWLRGRCVP